MEFAINLLAEGRVLVPWEHSQFSNLTQQDLPSTPSFHYSFIPSQVDYVGATTLLEDFTPGWNGLGNVWEAYRRTCPPGSPARQLYSSYRNANIQASNALLGEPQSADSNFAFVKTVGNDYDYCKNPWARHTQGHFFSDWRTIPVLSPVFTPSKVKGYADIRIPSHYYYARSPTYTYAYNPVADNNGTEIDNMEVPWDQKSDLIFWRGATTGGGSTPPGSTPTYQRHR